MDCEVVVVGGGIGQATRRLAGATVRMFACWNENVGGCAAGLKNLATVLSRVTVSSPDGTGGITIVFSAAAVSGFDDRAKPSSVFRTRHYTVGDKEDFEQNLRQTFPECAEQAVGFYRKLESIGGALRRSLRREPALLSVSKSRRAYSLLPEGRIAAEILRSSKQTTLQHLDGVSMRFRRFVDVQLQLLAQAPSNDVPYLHAALALTPRENMFAMRGGTAALAEKLAQSIKLSGGRIRLDTPVLRLSYDSNGAAVGVDLLSGETVTASKAVVSNLTVWDTYGKLVGLNRTPAEVRKQLNKIRGWGAYFLYAGAGRNRRGFVAADYVLVLTD